MASGKRSLRRQCEEAQRAGRLPAVLRPTDALVFLAMLGWLALTDDPPLIYPSREQIASATLIRKLDTISAAQARLRAARVLVRVTPGRRVGSQTLAPQYRFNPPTLWRHDMTPDELQEAAKALGQTDLQANALRRAIKEPGVKPQRPAIRLPDRRVLT